MEKPLEIDLHWTKRKLLIQRDVEAMTFIVELPKHASVQIHHTEKNIDVVSTGRLKKGKTVPIKETEVVRLAIAVCVE